MVHIRNLRMKVEPDPPDPSAHLYRLGQGATALRHRRTAMAAPEKHGLAKQFTRLIVLSGLASFLLLGFLQVVLNKSLRFYFDQPEVQTKASQQQVDELQNYISENALSSTDIQKLTDWTRSHRYNLLELYRDQVLIYSSYAPRHYYKDAPRPQSSPTASARPLLRLVARLYAELLGRRGHCTALLQRFRCLLWRRLRHPVVLCLTSFPLFFLWGSRGIVSYIVQLSEEVQAMEGGRPRPPHHRAGQRRADDACVQPRLHAAYPPPAA